MASELLKVFNKIEQDRFKCISNLNSIGIETAEDSSLSTIAVKILEKSEDNKFEDPLIWTRPKDWPDTKELLLSAPTIDGYTPFALFLLHDNRPNIRLGINQKSCTGTATRDYYYLSDGSFIEPPSGNASSYITHTWDTSKDIQTTLGYNLRYVIVYANNWRFNKPSSNRLMGDSADNTGIGISLLEMVYNPIFGNVYWRIPERQSNGSYVLNLQRLHILEGLEGSDFCNCNSSHLYHTIREIQMDQGGTFQYSATSMSAGFDTSSLNAKLIVPNLKCFYRDTTYGTTPSFSRIYAPELEEIKGTKGYSSFSTKFLDAPKLKKVESLITIGNGNMKMLPMLQDISQYNNISETNKIQYSNGILKDLNVTELSTLPTLLSSQCVYNKYITKITNTSVLASKSCNRIILPNLKEITLETLFNSSYLYELIIGDGFKSNLNLSSVKYITTVNLLDILNKLADVTLEATTYTLTLSSLLFELLSDAEKAIATNKGWIITQLN